MKKFFRICTTAVIILAAVLALGACSKGKGGSELYKRYLNNPSTPSIGNIYVDPNRDLSGSGAGTGNNGGGGGIFEGLPSESVDTCI